MAFIVKKEEILKQPFQPSNAAFRLNKVLVTAESGLHARFMVSTYQGASVSVAVHLAAFQVF